MTCAALAAGVLWLGYRAVALTLQNIGTGLPNLSQLNHVSGVKKREVIPTGCGCAVWMEKENAP